MLVGAYSGFAGYYRFAAADIASDAFRSRAISWVVAGGVVAAVAGTNIVRLTQNIGATQFLFTYLALTLLGIAALFVISRAVAARPCSQPHRRRCATVVDHHPPTRLHHRGDLLHGGLLHDVPGDDGHTAGHADVRLTRWATPPR